MTRRGVLFRSAARNGASDADLQLCEPDRLPRGTPVRVMSLPLTNAAIERFKGTWAAFRSGGPAGGGGRALHLAVYRGFPDDLAEHTRAIFEAVSEPQNLQMTVHCTAGKDRSRPRLARALVEVRREYLAEVFAAALDRYGSLDAYLREWIGVTEDLMRRLRETLLERPPGARRALRSPRAAAALSGCPRGSARRPRARFPASRSVSTFSVHGRAQARAADPLPSLGVEL